MDLNGDGEATDDERKGLFLRRILIRVFALIYEVAFRGIFVRIIDPGLRELRTLEVGNSSKLGKRLRTNSYRDRDDDRDGN